jgi:DNA excision repair protein ERCC-4
MGSGDAAPAGFSASHVMVTVDDREGRSGVLEALRQMAGVEVRMRRLKSGDYVVDNRWLFERKTLLDFARSIMDGRLFLQSWRLVNSSYPCALILEGRTRDLDGCQMHREALQGALVSLSLIYRLPVLRSFDPAETARLLIYAGRQLQRHDQAWTRPAGRRPKGRRRQQLHLLQALPGLGPKRALNLLEEFGTVQAVLTANLATLQTVSGIGAATAAAIRDVLQATASPD